MNAFPVGVIAAGTALRRVMSTPLWERANLEERVGLAVEALCEEMHPLGQFQMPAIYNLRKATRRQGRDAAMRAAFDGTNYRELSREYQLSPRQVRRIVHKTDD